MQNPTPNKRPFTVFREIAPGYRCLISTGHTLCVWVALTGGKWRSVTAIAWRITDADRRPN